MSEPDAAGAGPARDGSVPGAPAEADAPQGGSARGIRALGEEHFSLTDAVGGVRGAVESVAPGLVFVTVFVAAGQRLTPALVASAATALVATLLRLVQRTPVTQALSGVLGVGIGVIWAWRSGQAADYYAWGLLVNLGCLLGFAVSALVRWPLVGLVVGLFRPDGPMSSSGSWGAAVAWRADAELRRRYAVATWLWAGMFAARLLVQVPLYRADEVAWLGTAKLVMGLPLTALVLWASWLLVRGSTAAPPAPAPSRPAP